MSDFGPIMAIFAVIAAAVALIVGVFVVVALANAAGSSSPYTVPTSAPSVGGTGNDLLVVFSIVLAASGILAVIIHGLGGFRRDKSKPKQDRGRL